MNAPTRPPWWLVTYDLNADFFKLGPDVQYAMEFADAVDAVELALESTWKAAYTTTDFRKVWLLLQVKDESQALKAIQRYKMFPYLTNISCMPVYSATKAGINLKIMWEGFKKYLRDHLWASNASPAHQ